MSHSSYWTATHPWRPKFFSIVLLISGLVFIMLFLQHSWQGPTKVSDNQAFIIQILQISWLVPAPTALFGILGLISHSKPKKEAHVALDALVCFRIVTRGRDGNLVQATVDVINQVMRELPLFHHVVEVVTERAFQVTDCQTIVVAKNYITKNATKFKARALQYALDYSSLPQDSWLVHLDEESRPTHSAIISICEALDWELKNNAVRVWQGPIVFLRRSTSRFLGILDCARTGFDLSCFHLQLKLGLPLLGFRGSWLLVRNSLEKSIELDVGPHGSVAEDAWWATQLASLGIKFAWLSGYVTEQSPVTMLDFMRQRRRWLCGDILLLRYLNVKPRWKLALGWNVVVWIMAPVSLVTFWLDLFAGVQASTIVQVGGDISLAFIVVSMICGMAASNAAIWEAIIGILMLPVFSAMEAGAVLYGLVKFETGFHVVQKPEYAMKRKAA